MKGITAIRHCAICAAGVFLTLGLPFIRSETFSGLVSGTDAVSGASVVLDQPSGEYVLLINRELHTDAESLADWVTFFSGGEILYIFEDISCSVANGDSGGIELAESFRSQLPENQMTVKKEDATLLVSRLDHGKFDIAILSEEFAAAYQAETAYGGNVEVLHITGGAQ